MHEVDRIHIGIADVDRSTEHGIVVEQLAALLGDTADFSDAAKAARVVYRNASVPQALLDCRVGRIMVAKGLAREVEFACRFDALPVIPALERDRLRLLA